MTPLVRADGHPRSRLVLIGEAPGREEVERGRPFVGASGGLLAKWWQAVGINRWDCYIDNVVQRRPPGNKIEAIPADELAAWIDSLHTRLAALDDPWVIVPVGNVALQALTGKKSIVKYRGSIMEYVDRRGRRVKTIPTIHPAATFRTPYWTKRCEHDWRRIADEVTRREIVIPRRTHHIRPSVAAVEDYVARIARTDDPLAVDIETPGGIVGCVGFADREDESFTIPTTTAYWQSKETLSYVWRLIAQLCATPNPKVLQNGLFDSFYLRQLHGIRFVNYTYDLMWMHHTIDPLEDHNLAFMASMYTKQPYWKDEAKDVESIAKYASNAEALWTYNGIDCCVQRELFDPLYAELTQRGLLNVYQRTKAELLEPTLELMLHGIAVDHERRKRWLGRLLVERIQAEDALTKRVGQPLHATNGISPLRLKKWLIGQGVKLPRKRQPDGNWSETTDEAALRRVIRRYPKQRDVCEMVLAHRRASRLSVFLDESNYDRDGRMRSSYSPTADNGRFKSSSNPRGTGMNAQNQDREVREIYVPDDGCVFVELDTSQGEWRILAMLSDDRELVDLARKGPHEFDIHSFMASIIFNKPVEQVTKGERYLAKRIVHGSGYGLREDTMAEAFLTDKTALALGLAPSAVECGRWQRRYFDRFPIERWQEGVRATVLRERAITNSWGLRYDVGSQRLNDELYRQCYAFACASELAGLMNDHGFIPLGRWLRERSMRSRVNLHNHDALLVSCPPNEAYDVAQFLDRSLSKPHTYGGNALAMPCETKIGRTWKGDVEWKCLPSRGEFDAAVLSLTQRGLAVSA